MPEGVTIAADPTEVIARVLAPRVEEVEAEVAAAEGAEGPRPPRPRALADGPAAPAEDEG